MIERQNRFDCTLFIASTDPGVFLPADLLKYFEGLLVFQVLVLSFSSDRCCKPNHDDAKKQLLSKRPYIVVTLRDRASAIKAKEAIAKVTLPSNQSIVADFVPSNYVSREVFSFTSTSNGVLTSFPCPGESWTRKSLQRHRFALLHESCSWC